jgi:hypothetical protein
MARFQGSLDRCSKFFEKQPQLFGETNFDQCDIVVTAPRQTVKIHPRISTPFRLSTDCLAVIQTLTGFQAATEHNGSEN